ncbi:hypothetical protein Tco_0212711 [Tanacetum coccineum]
MEGEGDEWRGGGGDDEVDVVMPLMVVVVVAGGWPETAPETMEERSVWGLHYIVEKVVRAGTAQGPNNSKHNDNNRNKR